MSTTLEDAFARHERDLWGLAYRVTGSAAEADEVVQESFARALERPPADTTRPWLPWLRRVATNLARDRLRSRRRVEHVGSWLPEPVLTPELTDVQSAADARYELRERVSVAFLRALEELTPDQRVVLVLREVYELSVRETAETLELSQSNVKVLHHRARRALGALDPAPPPPAQVEATRAALAQLMMSVLQGDLEATRRLLSDEVEVVADAAGEFSANRQVVRGPETAATFLHRVALPRAPVKARAIVVNGLPALWLDWGAPPRVGRAPRALVRIELDDHARIARVENVMARAKLARLRRALARERA